MMKISYMFSEKWQKLNDGYMSSSSIFSNTILNTNVDDLEKKYYDFGIVKKLPNNEILLITDRFNTIPIYFAIIDNELLISDYVQRIVEKFDWPFDKFSAFEHLLFDFTFTSFNTLYKGICKVPAGSTVVIDSNGNYKIISNMLNEIPSLAAPMQFNSFVDYSQDLKQVILNFLAPHKSYYIPVSGGLDSRIVLGLVAKYTDAEILSRTYGSNLSLDVRNGRKVAKALHIKHEVFNKSDKIALEEFERTVIESGGELNGVHGHDILGRNKFEDSQISAKVSGFIGDLLARGSNLKVISHDKDFIIKQFITGRTNYNKYDYSELLMNNSEFSKNFLFDIVDDYVNNILKLYGNYESLIWDYYVTKRVGCMTSLLEYSTHLTKTNYKPFIIPDVVTFISSIAGYDKWMGMYYSYFAQTLIPELMKIPLSSNSIFLSKSDMYKYKIQKQLSYIVNKFVGRISLGTILPLEHNATLNWKAIIRRNKLWVETYLNLASDNFGLNRSYLCKIYNEHYYGHKDHEEFLLRVISLGVISANRC